MKKLLFILLAIATMTNCSSDDATNLPETIDLTIFNPELTIVENLDNQKFKL